MVSLYTAASVPRIGLYANYTTTIYD